MTLYIVGLPTTIQTIVGSHSDRTLHRYLTVEELEDLTIHKDHAVCERVRHNRQ